MEKGRKRVKTREKRKGKDAADSNGSAGVHSRVFRLVVLCRCFKRLLHRGYTLANLRYIYTRNEEPWKWTVFHRGRAIIPWTTISRAKRIFALPIKIVAWYRDKKRYGVSRLSPLPLFYFSHLVLYLSFDICFVHIGYRIYIVRTLRVLMKYPSILSN